MELFTRVETWPVARPVAITGHVFAAIDVLVVALEAGRASGRGEAYGVYYLGETAALMQQQVEAVRGAVEAGIDRDMLRAILPPGGARNALDAALWELQSQQERRSIASIAGVAAPDEIITTRTIWADDPAAMARDAAAHAALPALKLKLLGDGADAARIEAVRRFAPAARLMVDANQGFDRESYTALLPALVAARVALVEQPFPVGSDAWLDDVDRPIPVAADESFQSLTELQAMRGLYDWINIKLDKCGGLTEGLAIANAARAAGLGVMVGCMMATSLAMAPALVLAPLADLADIDGPLFLAADRPHPLVYREGRVSAPEALWGHNAVRWDRDREPQSTTSS